MFLFFLGGVGGGGNKKPFISEKKKLPRQRYCGAPVLDVGIFKLGRFDVGISNTWFFQDLRFFLNPNFEKEQKQACILGRETKHFEPSSVFGDVLVLKWLLFHMFFELKLLKDLGAMHVDSTWEYRIDHHLGYTSVCTGK